VRAIGSEPLWRRRANTRGQKDLLAREESLCELIYFKLYKSQLRVIDQTQETAGLMLGSDKSRGKNMDVLVLSLERLFALLPDRKQQEFLNKAAVAYEP
jgi:hypothetical protein